MSKEADLSRLFCEVRAARNALIAHLVPGDPEYHPSYEVTKADVMADYHFLRGMVFAYLYAGGWPHAGAILLTIDVNETVKARLGVDLLGLHVAAKNC